MSRKITNNVTAGTKVVFDGIAVVVKSVESGIATIDIPGGDVFSPKVKTLFVPVAELRAV
jgi:hypothetical protein